MSWYFPSPLRRVHEVRYPSKRIIPQFALDGDEDVHLEEIGQLSENTVRSSSFGTILASTKASWIVSEPSMKNKIIQGIELLIEKLQHRFHGENEEVYPCTFAITFQSL